MSTNFSWFSSRNFSLRQRHRTSAPLLCSRSLEVVSALRSLLCFNLLCSAGRDDTATRRSGPQLFFRSIYTRYIWIYIYTELGITLFPDRYNYIIYIYIYIYTWYTPLLKDTDLYWYLNLLGKGDCQQASTINFGFWLCSDSQIPGIISIWQMAPAQISQEIIKIKYGVTFICNIFL